MVCASIFGGLAAMEALTASMAVLAAAVVLVALALAGVAIVAVLSLKGLADVARTKPWRVYWIGREASRMHSLRPDGLLDTEGGQPSDSPPRPLMEPEDDEADVVDFANQM